MEPQTLIRTVRRFKRAYASALGPPAEAFGLTRNEVDVLLFLANNPGRDTARDIVELRGLSKSHVCQSVEELTRRGWLSAVPDGRDRRMVRLALTPAAAPAAEAARKAQRGFFHRLFQGIAEEERRALGAALETMYRNLEED